MPQFDVTIWRGRPGPRVDEFELVGVVDALGHTAAHAEARRRWPDVPPHRLFIERQKGQEGAQVPPSEPNGAK